MIRSPLPWLIGAALLFPLPAQAAPEPETGRLRLTLAYFGETLTHPGVMIGAEQAFWRYRGHELLTATNFGAYHHAGNHNGLFLNGELGYRFTFPARISTEALIGAGMLHSALPGDVYLPGQTSPSRDGGRMAFMPSGTLGVGYTLGDKRLFARLQGFGQAPYNTYTLLHLATQVGMTWSFR